MSQDTSKERSQDTRVPREVWSSGGVFSGFSLDRLLGYALLTSLCCDLCVLGEHLKRWRRGGQSWRVFDIMQWWSMQLPSPPWPIWMQGTGSSFSAFVATSPWWHISVCLMKQLSFQSFVPKNPLKSGNL